MRWILMVVLALVALGLIVAAVGAALPTAHVASVSARVDATPEQVWRTITDVARFPEWRSDVSRVELESGDAEPRSWIEHSSNGRIPLVVERSDPPRLLVVRIADPELPFGGTWTYDVAPEAGGSVVTITEHGEVYNPIFRFMARFVFGHHRTLQDYIDALGRRVASAEHRRGV